MLVLSVVIVAELGVVVINGVSAGKVVVSVVAVVDWSPQLAKARSVQKAGSNKIFLFMVFCVSFGKALKT